MTATINLLDSSSSGTGTPETHASGSFTPTANAKLYAWHVGENNSHGTTQDASASGGSLTWTRIEYSAQSSWNGDANFALRGALFEATAPGSPSSMTVTVDPWTTSNNGYHSLIVFEIVGTDVTVVQSDVAGESEGGGSSESLTVTMTQAATSGNLVVCGFGGAGDTVAACATPSGFSDLGTPQSQTATHVGVYHRSDFTGSSVTCSDLGDAVGNSAGFVIEFAETVSATIEQEGFRWRNDDGSETTATWKRAQDTHVTSPLGENIRLRTLVDTIDDYPSTAYTLRYKLSSEGTYVVVPVGTTGPGPAPVVEGTAESSTNTAGTSHTVTLPASISSTDGVLITMDIGSTAATLNALTDWTEVLDENSANGLKILWYQGTGVPGNPTFTSSANTRDASISWRISGVDRSVLPEIAASTAAATSATPDPPSITPSGGEKAHLFIAFYGAAGEEGDDDTWSDTPPTNYGPTPPLQKSCGTAGTNLGGMIAAAHRQLTTGSAEDPGTFAKDVSAAWRAQTICIHPANVNNRIYVATSANVTAGGEATTAQLAAPSGKTTSDFTTGRMWDNENGSDATDIAADFYTELEWSLQAQSPAVDDDVYQFRTYAAGTAFDTYTVTPEWTIGTDESTVSLGLVTETDSAHALTIVEQAAAFGQSSETDSAHAVAPAKTVVLGLATEIDSSFAVTVVKDAFTLGLATETDSAFTVTQAGQSVTLDLPVETDSAHALGTTAKTVTLGIAVQTDSAHAVTAAKAAVVVGLATETDSALTLVWLEAVTLGQASETDSAFTITTAAFGGLYPTSVSADEHHFLDQNGNPWMMFGDSGWVLFGQLTVAEVDDYLEDRAARGFNANLCLFVDNGAFTTNGPNNAANDPPFTGTPYESTLADAFWDHVEYVIGKGAQLGITFVITPAYFGIVDDGWRVELAAATDAEIEDFGEAIGARFKDYPNIIWVAGGDHSMDATLNARMDAMFTGLTTAGDTHLRTYHTADGERGAAQAAGEPWFDVDTVYDYGTADDDIVELSNASYTDTAHLPTFYIEGRYEWENSSTRHSLRRQIYSPVLGGCLGGWIWGNSPIWHFNGIADGPSGWETWEENVGLAGHGGPSPSTPDVEIAITFFSAIEDWHNLAPDTTDTFLTSGESSGVNIAAAAFSTERGYVYVPTNRNVTVDLAELSPDTVRARWFDPTDGTYDLVGVFSTTGGQSFTHPGNNAGGDADWILVLEGVPVVIVGQPSETDSAHTLGATTKTVVLGLAAETDSAFTVTVTAPVDVTPSPTVVVAVSATAGLGAQADINPAATFVAVAAAVAGIGTESAVTPAATIVVARTAVAALGAQADIAPTSSVVVAASATANIGVAGVVEPAATIVQTRSAVANIVGHATVTPTATVVTVVAAVADTAAVTVVTPTGTVAQTRSAVAAITVQSDIAGHTAVVTPTAAVAALGAQADINPAATIVAAIAAIVDIARFIPDYNIAPTATAHQHTIIIGHQPGTIRGRPVT